MKLVVASCGVLIAVMAAASDVCAQSVPETTPNSIVMPATTRSQAHEQAKSESGRMDPLAPVTGFKHFPTHDAKVVPPDKVLMPAPLIKESGKSLSAINPMLRVPPPPADVQSYPGSTNELPVSELPEPPERPSLLNTLKLTGIVGDKAIFAVTDSQARARNHWPKMLTLAAGDRFEGISGDFGRRSECRA